MNLIKLLYKKQKLKFKIKNKGLYKIDKILRDVIKELLKKRRENKRTFYFLKAIIRSYINFKKKELVKINKNY
jgi:hypothetical protein